jgi:alcohol dehydrogenase class IV
MTATNTVALRGLIVEAGDRGDAPPVTQGRGTSRWLPDLVAGYGRRVLVVASPRTVAGVPAVRALLDRGAAGHHSTRANPTTWDALKLSAVIDRVRPDVVVAVGGGSAIDLAKAARMLTPERGSLQDALAAKPSALRPDPPSLVAVPTTAGTGSEVTCFATLYHEREKVSLDAPGARPDHALLDAELVRSCPSAVAVAAALDALCHAIESAWNRDATPLSRRYAAAAAAALVHNLAPGQPTAGLLSPDRAEQRQLAATVAGIAIGLTRTTAAHAFSYRLTAHHGIAHGYACALNLVWLADHNWRARSTGDADLEKVLRSLGCDPGADPAAPVPTVVRVLRAAEHAGLFTPPRLTDAEFSTYLAAGLGVRGRVDRNPVTLDPGLVRERIVSSRLLTSTHHSTHHIPAGRIR